MGAVKNHFHDEICAMDEPAFPEPGCLTCMDRGMVGGCVGQTPENMDWVSEPCPDCTPRDGLTERLTKVAFATEFLDVRADILALIERDRSRWLDNIAVCKLLAEARAQRDAHPSGAPDRPRR